MNSFEIGPGEEDSRLSLARARAEGWTGTYPRYHPAGGTGISLQDVLGVMRRNLWIIEDDVPYGDPESGLGSGNLGMGYLSGAYPATRNVGFNVRFRF